jgi:membrane protease YdiL (CAAX protease family)
MAYRVAEPAPTPRGRWVWALALAPILPTLNWYFARSDTIGLIGHGGAWLRVSGPEWSGLVAFGVTFVVLGIVPALLTSPIYGKSPWQLGLGAGNVNTGMPLLGLGVAIAIAVAYASRTSPELAAVYPLGSPSLAWRSWIPHVVGYGLYYLGFEYFFRGFLLFGLTPRLGPAAANVLQAGIVTMAHLGKPDIELAAAFPASLIFGWIALRTGSIWYALGIHWAVGVALDWFLLSAR